MITRECVIFSGFLTSSDLWPWTFELGSI